MSGGQHDQVVSVVVVMLVCSPVVLRTVSYHLSTCPINLDCSARFPDEWLVTVPPQTSALPSGKLYGDVFAECEGRQPACTVADRAQMMMRVSGCEGHLLREWN